MTFWFFADAFHKQAKQVGIGFVRPQARHKVYARLKLQTGFEITVSGKAHTVAAVTEFVADGTDKTDFAFETFQ